MICAFSGHRPHRLPWQTDEEDPRCLALKTTLESKLEALAEYNPLICLCGMARGCDTYFAEAVLKLQQRNADVQLWAILPCRSQSDTWPVGDRTRYHGLCSRCTRVIYIQQEYSKDCMRLRNQWMVDHAECLLTVYDGGAGGTSWTVRAAQKKGIPLIPLWV